MNLETQFARAVGENERQRSSIRAPRDGRQWRKYNVDNAQNPCNYCVIQSLRFLRTFLRWPQAQLL